jgi:hypothetical protein
MTSARLSIRGIANEDAERLTNRVRISSNAIEEARDSWEASTNALLAGARAVGNQDVTVARLRRRYTAIKRLTAEARRMIMLSAAPETRQAVYAIDPHLIAGYCSFWDDSKFAAFNFLEKEWREGEQDDRIRFIVYLLGSILRMDNLICLEAGREEIADMLAHFLQGHEKSPDHDDQIAKFASSLENIQRTVDFSEQIKVPPEKISQFIMGKFEAMVGAGGIPLMQQQLSAARLAYILRARTLKASFFALRDKLGPDQQKPIALAEKLFCAIRRDDEFVRDARTSFYEAYASFSRAVTVRGEGLLSDDVARFRPGEFANIHALFELHLLNICLSEAGVRARIRYITDSLAMFSFVSAFQPDALEVELVHPRHVFIFENRLTGGNLDRFQQVVTAPDAFADAVSADGAIRVDELDTFEEKYADTLRDVRATYSFAAMDFEPAREALADVMRRFIDDHGGRRSAELHANLSNIAERIAETSESVRRAFNRTAPELSELGFEAYKEFVENLSGEGRRTLMLVRRFGMDGGKGNAIPRLVCVPVGGGYRQIIKIYQPDVVKQLGNYDDAIGTIDVSTVIKSIKDILDRASGDDRTAPDAAVAAALPDYTRALYAMVGREWLLAQTYCKTALRTLDPRDELKADDLEIVHGDCPEARRRLMVQEVLIVQHFARRGIGTNLEGIGRRRRWLKLAAEDLYEAGRLIASVGDRGSYATRYDPNSVRLALAAFGMLIEWLALRAIRRPKGRPLDAEEGGALLPQVDQPDLAWQGLASLMCPLSTHWGDNDAGRKIRADLDELNRRIGDILGQVRQGDDQIAHSYEFWRYIAVRGLGIRSLLDLMGRLSLVELDAEGDADRVDPHVAALFAEHEEYMEGHRKASSGGETDTLVPLHPFKDLILAAHLLMDLPETDTASQSLSIKLRRGEILLSISRLQHALSPTGFPRSISKALLSRYGGDAAAQLREVANMLEREALLAGT